jgi:hypothetical protein
LRVYFLTDPLSVQGELRGDPEPRGAEIAAFRLALQVHSKDETPPDRLLLPLDPILVAMLK